jgi:transcriptional regulator CtsR
MGKYNKLAKKIAKKVEKRISRKLTKAILSRLDLEKLVTSRSFDDKK